MTPEQEKEMLDLAKKGLRLQKIMLAVMVVIGLAVVPFAAVLSSSFVLNALGSNSGLL